MLTIKPHIYYCPIFMKFNMIYYQDNILWFNGWIIEILCLWQVIQRSKRIKTKQVLGIIISKLQSPMREPMFKYEGKHC